MTTEDRAAMHAAFAAKYGVNRAGARDNCYEDFESGWQARGELASVKPVMVPYIQYDEPTDPGNKAWRVCLNVPQDKLILWAGDTEAEAREYLAKCGAKQGVVEESALLAALLASVKYVLTTTSGITYNDEAMEQLQRYYGEYLAATNPKE